MNINKDSIIQKVNNIAQFMGNATYFRAMRDAFAMVVPFLVLTGFVILFNFVVIAPDGFLADYINPNSLVKAQLLGNKIIAGTMSILSLLIVVLVSYSLSVTRKAKNPIIPVAVALSCMFVLMPTSFEIIPNGMEKAIEVSGMVSYTLTGSGGMFVAIFTGILSTELFLKLSGIEKLQIKMSGSIPPAVIQTFNSLIAVMLTILTFAIVSFTIVMLTGDDVNEIIVNVIQAPLVNLTTSLPGFLVLCMLTNLLFFFGIHAGGIINPILEPPLLVAMQENVQAFAANQDIPNIIVLPFRDLYGHLGGTGSTIALLIVIFVLSKRKEHKQFAKMVIPTSIFNINEPIVFGFPIIFNPFMLIPFVFGPLVLFTVAYFATYLGLVSPIVAYVPWSVPPLISGWLGSAGDIRNVILQLVLIAMQVAMYIPFFKLYERSLNIMDKERANEKIESKVGD